MGEGEIQDRISVSAHLEELKCSVNPTGLLGCPTRLYGRILSACLVGGRVSGGGSCGWC